VAFDDIEHVLRLGRAWPQDAGAANRQWEIERVAQSVGKKQLRGAEAAITFRHGQNALGVALGANHHVMLQMDAALESR